ncbi:MAG TPA: hypothetical protein VHZ07_03550 [Bryobacteraceae bacterium]|jgi:hypothetical protein|nr:hypothetical protein [Bryobacteraceae bacterium]
MDSQEQRYARLKDAVQQAILRDFPNAERKGCPGDEVVREVAARRELIEDDLWHHITHCSPCYATFLQDKDEIRGERRRRGLLILVGAALAACVLILVGVWWAGVLPGHHTQRTSLVAEDRTVDLYDWDAQRGGGLKEGPEIALPRTPVRVRVILPRFSSQGAYQIAVCRSRTIESAIAESTASAIQEGPRETVTVQLDLRSTKPGNFWFATKRESDEAGYYFPVHVS